MRCRFVSAPVSLCVHMLAYVCWSICCLLAGTSAGHMHVIICRFMSASVHVRLSAPAHRRSTENMSKSVSPTGVSPPNIWLAHFKRSERQAGWGKATEEGQTTVIKKWRAEGQGPRPHHSGVHLLDGSPSARKLLFFLRVFVSRSGHSEQKRGRHLEPIETTTVHLQGEGNTSL